MGFLYFSSFNINLIEKGENLEEREKSEAIEREKGENLEERVKREAIEDGEERLKRVKIEASEERVERDEFFSTGGRCVYRLMADTGLFKRDPVCILADPFLFKKNVEKSDEENSEKKGVESSEKSTGKSEAEGEELFLFYEYQCKRYGRGELRMRKTRDLVHWSEEWTVLREDFHLSFPNVFEDNGEYYMIPETGADGSIRLYKATDESLANFRPYRTIIRDGRKWADSDIVKKDGKYYLFTSIYSRKAPEARLFVAGSLDGEFKEHPCSPYSTSPANARNAGRIFEHEGKLFRPVQDNTKGYGKQLSIMEITALSPDSYNETLHREHILDAEDKFYKRGGHQFCPITFAGRTIIATDGKQRNYNIRENINGYCHHLRKRG